MKVNSFYIKPHRIAALVIALSFVSSSSLPVEAQDPVSGALQGVIVDRRTRAPIEGAGVRIFNVESKLELAKKTNKEGRFHQGFLPPGEYRIGLLAPGFQAKEVLVTVFATLVNEVVPSPIELDPVDPQPESEKRPSASGALAVGSLPNAAILVESLRDSSKFKRVIPPGELLCVFDDLPPESYRVTATLGGYQSAEGEVTIAANKILSLTLALSPNVASSQIVAQSGRYYALVIGNNAYRSIRPLRTAVNDAKAVETNLREGFGFQTRLLLNAEREEIMAALNEYRRKLEPNANLLIYYAGHGHNDTEAEETYWLPINASKEHNANWISANDITTAIKAIPAKHILLVSDSCYSGTITRSPEIRLFPPDEPTYMDRYLQKMSAGKSRTLMASGGNEPVADSGGGGHSVFANAFLMGLTKMDRDIFSAELLYFNFIRIPVSGKSNQTPEYNPIRNSGHENGDFVFLRKKR